MRRKFNLIHKLNLRKDDTVMVISGDDKGKSGRIIAIYPEKRKAVVEGLNMVTKHVKPNAEQTGGGRVEQEAALHLSKLMLIDPKTTKPTRVALTKVTDKKGKTTTERVSVKTKEVIK